MSFCNRAFLPVVAIFGLAFLVGCGGSSTHTPVSPPTGGFSNSNLNGTYTFSVAGFDILVNGSPSTFNMAGSLTACGCSGGTISAGTITLVDFSSSKPATSVALNSNSAYSITKDGRGLAKLFFGAAPAAEVDLDFVLTSSSHGLVTRFDNGGAGSGTIDLQSSGVTLATTPYSFSISGTDGLSNPFAMAGSFTLDSSGNITAGIVDTNSNGTVQTALSPLTGTVTPGSGTTPGTASFSIGSLTFDVYAIDATHLKLVETDDTEFTSGDAFSQGTDAIPSGNLVLSMAGLDLSGNPAAFGGIMASAGGTFSNGIADVNDNGLTDGVANPSAPAPVNFSGTFVETPSGSGRWAVSFTGFPGGTAFAAYPSTGGVLMLEVDGGVAGAVTAGAAMAQTSGAAVAASQGYGMNLTGFDVGNGVPLNQIAQFNTTSSGLSGLIDQVDFTISKPGTSNLVGNYTAPASNGIGQVGFTNGQNFFYYPVDNSTILFLASDGGEVSLGAFQTQSTPTSAAAQVVERQMAMVKAVKATRRRQVK